MFLKEGINLSERIQLWHGDALELLKTIPDKSVDLVLTDPPYNVGVSTMKNGKAVVNEWDRIDDYMAWSLQWILESQRVLKNSGILYFWHNDMAQIAELLELVRKETALRLQSFCIWDKGNAYRTQTWKNRMPDENDVGLSTWFNVCEYCVHFFKISTDIDRVKKSQEMLSSINDAFEPLIDWYKGELKRLHITEQDVAEKYTEATGRKPYMLHHYFNHSQFEVPQEDIWNKVYIPLGFGYSYKELWEEVRRLRPYHKVDPMHCNIWHVPPIPSTKRYHTCQKPVSILGRLCRVSCPPDGLVLDPFMGSASTAIACIKTGRRFIGIEKDATYFDIAKKRVDLEESALNLFTQEEIEETA